MKAENLAVLLLARERLTSKVKPNNKTIGTTVPKTGRVVIALPDAGREDWQRFKRECVLLKGGKSK